jgi:hypothetical protein
LRPAIVLARFVPSSAWIALASLLLAPAASIAQKVSTDGIAPITTAQLDAFRPRLIGPAVAGGRVHDVEALPHDPSTIFVASASEGPWVSPGTYTVTLEARGATFTQTVEVRGDPLLSVTQAMYEEREAYLLQLRRSRAADPRGKAGLAVWAQRGPGRDRRRSLRSPAPNQTVDGSSGGTRSAAGLASSAHPGAYRTKSGDRGSPRPPSPIHQRRPLTMMNQNDE